MRILGKAARALLVVTTLVALAQASTTAFGAASTTTLTSSPNPSAFGETVTLKAIVGSAGAPTGTVTFKDGTATLGDVAVDTVGVGQPIAAGGNHTCALTGAGGVKCWGWNNFGQLGNAANVGTHTANPGPLDVTGLGSGVVAVAAGTSHACALTATGGVKCWGRNNRGQLGNATNAGTESANPDPLNVTGLDSGVVAIAAGDFHTCAITDVGGVKCWGNNSLGQLGNTANSGSHTPNPAPLDVTDLASGVVAIAAGISYTCALTSTGGIKCWGNNFFGQLGNTVNNGFNTPNPAPLDVTNLASGVVAITCGLGHTCAVTEDGGVKCWGWNSRGQLGSTTNVGTDNPNPDPLDVTGLGSGAAAIAAGIEHTCALTEDGGVKCWGLNTRGQLGNASNAGTFDPNPAPLDVTGLGSGATAVAVGMTHSCALTSTEAGKCWGRNTHGQLGNATNSGTENSNPTPLDVSNLTAMVFGEAKLETAALAVGGHSLTAEYSGDADHDPSTSEPVGHLVPRHTTSVALGSSQNPSVFGQSVTFTATVGSDHGSPEGTVLFRKGGSNFARRPMVGGVATLETAALPPGTHSITARYQRSDDYRDSTSAPVPQEVQQGQTTTTLTIRPSTSGPGQPVNLIAIVAPVAPAGGKPHGTVTFKNGADELGTVSLANQRATLAVNDFAMGNHSLTASYNGSTNYAPSSSSATAHVVSPLVGGAIAVNQNPANATKEKRFPAIARLADGGFVIAWQQQTDSEGWNILARRYHANGRPAGREFRVNAGRANDQIGASVAGLAGGGFVVVWGSNQKPQFGFDVFGQRYDAAGAAVGGPFRVNTTQASDQHSPSIASLGGDAFVVVWTSLGQDGSGEGIFGKRYDDTGAEVGGELPVNTTTAVNQSFPAVARLGGDGFVITWASNHGADGYDDIYGQRYDFDGQAVAGEFRINSTQTDNQQHSSVSGRDNGGFVVTWTSLNQDGEGTGIYGQRYDLAGIAEGGEFRVNTTIANSQAFSSVASFPDGGFIVVWRSFGQDGDGTGIVGQAYDAVGEAIESEFLVNTATEGDQINPKVITGPGGTFVAVWWSRVNLEHSIVAQRGQVQGLGGP